MATNDRAGSMHIISRELAAAKRYLDVGECKPGMILAEPLMSESGAVILQEKTVLTEAMLERLRKLPFDRIKVQNPEVDAEKAIAQYQAQYTACLDRMGSLFSLAAHGKKLSVEQVQDATNTVLESTAAGGTLYFRAEKPQLPHTTGQLQIHSLNTAMLAAFLHHWMELDEALLPITVQGALLHDIGKTRLNPRLLELPGALSPKEDALWKRHPREGWEMLQKCKGLHPLVGTVVAMHHERPDGTGYPMKLRGANIHPLARVVAIADRFDNLTAGSARERSVSPFQALTILEQEAAQGFHPVEIRRLLAHVPAHYVGERFFLSNGEIGEVLHINPDDLGRPLLRTAKGFVDLAREPGIQIEAMV